MKIVLRLWAMMQRRTSILFSLCCALGMALAVGHAAAAGTLKRGLGPEPDSLDPHQAQGLSALNVARDLYEGLVTLDAAGEPRPGSASAWVKKDEGRRYEFRLRPNLRWSDGSVLSATDFVRGLRHAVDPKTAAPYAGLLDVLVNASAIRSGELPPSSLGVKALDATRVEVQLVQPAPQLLEVLAHPVSSPKASQPGRTNGPFVLAERVAQSHLVLKANSRYHGAEYLGLDEVHWVVSEDNNRELSRYRAGELHITETIPPGRYQWLQENLGDDLHISPYLGSFFLAFNLKREPFKDQLKLRQALSLAVDRDTLTRVVTAAGEQPAFGLVAPGLKEYTYPELVYQTMTQEERLGLARALYRQAGYSDENPLRVTLRYNTSTQQRRIAAAISAMWREYLGVVTELYNEEWKVFINSRKQGLNTQVVRGGWIADLADPFSFLEPFRSNSSLNYTGFDDKQFEQWIERSMRADNPYQRNDALTRAEARLLQQQAIIPLYYYVSRHLVKPVVRGYVDNVMDIHLSRYLSLADQP